MNAAGCLLCIILVPLAAAGLGLIHQGLSRSRSASHTTLAVLCSFGISAIAFVIIGSALAGYPAAPARTLSAFGQHWNLVGAAPSLAFAGPEQTGDARASNNLMLLCLEMLAAGLTSVIAVGAGSDRWRLAPICLASTLCAALLFPLLAHWVWGGGWLADLGREFGIPPFLDFGGAAPIHVLGGFMSICVVWIAGPRRGKFVDDGMAAAIPAHNIVLVLFGCILGWIGWLGLQAATSVLGYGAELDRLVLLIINATLAASGACLAALLITRARFGKPDASLCANGWMAGIVAGSASCGWVSPVAALVIGAVAGILTTYAIEVLEVRYRIDDPAGSISVHAVAGIWGLLAVGIFGRFTDGDRAAHVLAQLLGIGVLLGLILPVSYAANLLVDRLCSYRVDEDGDWRGMDIRELGAGAYPEFLTHTDDFTQR